MFSVLTMVGAVHGLPIPAISFGLPRRIDVVANQGTSCNDLHQCRTLRSIVWSCVAVVLSCTWNSMHPNIPGPYEKWHRIALRRVGLMTAALIAPEFVVVWAMRQRIVARRLEEEYQARKWTKAHGFFAIMGGFVLYDGNKLEKTLLPHDLADLSARGEIDFPEVSEEEVNIRSEGDLVSKGLVILQTGWFLIQSIARLAEGLLITELEVVTFAFAILNIAIYRMWWEKPQNVGSALCVRVLRNKMTVTDEAGDGDRDRRGGSESLEAKIAARNSHEVERGMVATVVHKVQRAVDKYGWGCFFLWAQPFAALGGVSSAAENYNSVEKRVDTFYAGATDDGEDKRVLFAAVVVATIFGGFHLVAWSSMMFPSDAEKFLWRFSSIVITSLPVVVWALGVLLSLLEKSQHLSSPQSLPKELLSVLTLLIVLVVLVLLSTLYALCRVSLLVLPLLSLRSAPSQAYMTVRWTMLIPHL